MKSLSVQNEVSCEFIYVDDESTDNSIEIIDSFQKNDVRFRTFSKKHEGVSSARNKGLDIVTGKYVCFVDSDDYLKKGSLKMIFDLAEKYSCDSIKFNAKIKHGKKWMKNVFKHHRELIKNFGPNEIFRYMDSRPFVWAHFIRRSKLIGIRFDETLDIGEDQEFIIRYLVNCNTVLLLEKTLYVHNNRY